MKNIKKWITEEVITLPLGIKLAYVGMIVILIVAFYKKGAN